MQAPSRPMLIGLLCVLAFAGVYFVALKPPGKGADSTSPYNGPIAQAKSAVAQSQAAAAKAEHIGQTTTGPIATPIALSHPASGAPQTKPVVKPAPVKHAAANPGIPAGVQPWDQSRTIFEVLAHHHVAVVLFWTKGQTDDDATYRAVQAVRADRGVRVFNVAMSDVGNYTAIASAASVSDSPTTLIIGPDRRFQTIVGYTISAAVQQAIGLARR